MGYFAVSYFPVLSVRLTGARDAIEAVRSFRDRINERPEWLFRRRDDLGRSVGRALPSGRVAIEAMLKETGARELGAVQGWWLWWLADGCDDAPAFAHDTGAVLGVFDESMEIA